MLSSFRMAPASMPMPLVQLPNGWYCTSTNQRQKILRTRSEQKQLYGEIIRTEPKDDAKQSKFNQYADASAGELNKMNVLAGNRASEFHWLVKRGKSAKSAIKINVFGKDASKIEPQSPPSQNSKLPPPPDTPLKANGAIISAKKLLQSFVTRKHTEEIPFDANELSAIVKYPLVSNKCSLSQTISLTDKSMKIPSISKVLTATMPEHARTALKKWKTAKMTELGVDGFKQYERETLNLGKEFHSAIEQYLSNGDVPDANASINQLWQSVNPSLNELKPKPILMEQQILHADLKYKGIIDNVSMVRDQLCAFEWKTSEKAKPKLTSTYDAPVQLCAYLGALNADPRYDLVVKHGRVVVAYKNGDLANVFELTESDLRKYWLIWLQRLQEYWIRVKDGTLPDPI